MKTSNFKYFCFFCFVHTTLSLLNKTIFFYFCCCVVLAYGDDDEVDEDE